MNKKEDGERMEKEGKRNMGDGLELQLLPHSCSFYQSLLRGPAGLGIT